MHIEDQWYIYFYIWAILYFEDPESRCVHIWFLLLLPHRGCDPHWCTLHHGF